MKNSEEEKQTVLNGAIELSKTIHQFIYARKNLRKHGMTVVGLAVEMLLSAAPTDWDEVSEHFRDFLGTAHNDLKRLSKTMDFKAN